MKLSEMEARGTKTLTGDAPATEPNWFVWTLMKLYRIVLLTILWTGLGMGVGLFFGIIAIVVHSAVRHVSPDMSLAYRFVAVRAAMLSGSCALLWNLGRAVQAGIAKSRAKKAG